jgi:hypothetical protein
MKHNKKHEGRGVLHLHLGGPWLFPLWPVKLGCGGKRRRWRRLVVLGWEAELLGYRRFGFYRYGVTRPAGA